MIYILQQSLFVVQTLAHEYQKRTLLTYNLLIQNDLDVTTVCL